MFDEPLSGSTLNAQNEAQEPQQLPSMPSLPNIPEGLPSSPAKIAQYAGFKRQLQRQMLEQKRVSASVPKKYFVHTSPLSSRENRTPNKGEQGQQRRQNRDHVSLIEIKKEMVENSFNNVPSHDGRHR